MPKIKKPPTQPRPKTAAADARPKTPTHTNLLVGTTVAASILSVIISFAPLTPVLVTAPLAYVLLKRAKLPDHRLVTVVVLRWALTVFFTALVASAFVTDRVAASFPYAASAAAVMTALITGSTHSAPAGFLYIAAGMAAFVLAGFFTVGIAGYVLWAGALGVSAAAAASLYALGNNLVQVTLIALPPWQIAFFAACIYAAAPVTSASRRFLYRKNDAGNDWKDIRFYVLTAAGLFVLSLLLRAAVSGIYLNLVRHWSIG